MQEYFDGHEMDGSNDPHLPGRIPERAGRSTPGDKGQGDRQDPKEVRKKNKRNPKPYIHKNKPGDREGEGGSVDWKDKLQGIVHFPDRKFPCPSCFEIDRLTAKGFAVAVSRGDRGAHVRVVRGEKVFEQYNASLSEAMKAAFLEVMSK